jgi:phospholipid transport system substrate-binding protein
MFSCIFYLLVFAAPSIADEPGEVKALLVGKIDAVVVILQNKSEDKSRRNERIIEIITPIFDYQIMARLSLGKKYWPALSQTKRTAFSDLFITRLQESYLEKLDLYSDEKILYETPLVKGKKIHIPTTLISKDSRIEMLYKFYRAKVGWKIYDLEIGGVSVIQTYRSQFDGLLKDGTIDDLLEKLNTDGTFVTPSSDEKGARPGSG